MTKNNQDLDLSTNLSNSNTSLTEPAEFSDADFAASMDMRSRVQKLLKAINKNMIEREETTSLTLLAAIGGFNTFLYGPPGTAKSLIARRISKVFASDGYFECLMHRYLAPDDVFGPVSLSKLKQDSYTRETQGYLPTADFAFLDEIWKSSPVILNSLLTIVNEKLYKNGKDLQKVPLKSLVAASNEIPEEGQGLEALYDRFILRLLVNPITKENNFRNLIQGTSVSDQIDLSADLRISNPELTYWREKIKKIKFTEVALNAFLHIKAEIKKLNQQILDAKENEEAEENELADLEPIYVSDRRWLAAAQFLRTAAFCNGRDYVVTADLFLLKNVIWTSDRNRDLVADLIDNAIKESLTTKVENEDLAKLEAEFDILQKQRQVLYYDKNEAHLYHIPGVSRYISSTGSFPQNYIGFHAKLTGTDSDNDMYYLSSEVLNLPDLKLGDNGEIKNLPKDYFQVVDAKGQPVVYNSNPYEIKNPIHNSMNLFWFGSKLDDERVALWLATTVNPKSQEVRKFGVVRVKKLKGTKRLDVQASSNLKANFEALQQDYRDFLTKIGTQELQESQGKNSLFVTSAEKRALNKADSQSLEAIVKNKIAKIDIEIGLC